MKKEKNRHPDREMLAAQRAKGAMGVKGVDLAQKHKIVWSK